MSEPRAQGAVNLKCPPCLWSVFLNKTETLSIQYPTLAPWDQKGLEEVRFILLTERLKDPEEKKKENYEFPTSKRCWSKGWLPWSWLHDRQRMLSRQLPLVSCVIMPLSFLRWWTSLTSRDWYWDKHSPFSGIFRWTISRSSTAFLSSPLSPRRVAGSGGAFGR